MAVVQAQAQSGRFAPRRVRERPRQLALVGIIGALIGVVAVIAFFVAASGGSADRELLLGVSDLTYSTRSLRAQAGELHLAFANTDAVPHTFTIEALDVEVEAGGGEAARLTFTAEPGSYDFICTIPGHDTPSMRGVLTVEP